MNMIHPQLLKELRDAEDKELFTLKYTWQHRIYIKLNYSTITSRQLQQVQKRIETVYNHRAEIYRTRLELAIVVFPELKPL